MTVTVTTQPVVESRVIPGLPAGVQQWTAQITGTAGVGSGTLDLVVEFNEGSTRNFQPYVAIQGGYFHNSVADIGDGQIFGAGDDWERTVRVGVANGATRIPFHFDEIIGRLVDTLDFVGTFRRWTHLGRVELGTAGRVTMRFDEVDTAVVDMGLTGLISDRPFILHSDWVV